MFIESCGVKESAKWKIVFSPQRNRGSQRDLDISHKGTKLTEKTPRFSLSQWLSVAYKLPLYEILQIEKAVTALKRLLTID